MSAIIYILDTLLGLALFVVLARLLFRRGLRQYSAYGG